MLVARCPNHGFSKLLIDHIGNTHCSFAHQTLTFKLKNSMPRHISDTPQQLFISCDISQMIDSIPMQNNFLRQAQSLSQQCNSNVNQSTAAISMPIDNQQRVQCGSKTSSARDICKRPPTRIENSIVEVVQKWIDNSCDKTLDVLAAPYLKRKIWTHEKGMRCNFNKRKSTIGLVDKHADGTIGRIEAAMKLDEERKVKNQYVSEWRRKTQLALVESESNK